MHIQQYSQRIRIILVACSLVVFSGLLSQQLTRADDTTDATDPRIIKLETQFFEHTYPNDSTGSRLTRLEQMVFGESRPGSNADRLNKLVAAIPDPSVTAIGSDETQAAADSQASPSANSSSPGATPVSSTGSSYTDTTNYPEVTAIETQYFGKNFAGEPVTKRLERLEVKMFGKPRSGALVDRVDYLRQQTGIDVAQSSPNTDGDTGGGSNSSNLANNQGLDQSGNMGVPYSPPSSMPPSSYNHTASSYNRTGGTTSNNPNRQPSQRRLVPIQSASNPGVQPGLPPPSPAPIGYGAPVYGGGPPVAPAPSGGSGTYLDQVAPQLARNSYYGSGPPVAPQVPVAYSAPPYVPPYQQGGFYQGQPSTQSSNLQSQIDILEQSVFGKIYLDTLSNRLTRLETMVFPQNQPWLGGSLTERVSRLWSVVRPQSGTGPTQPGGY